MRYSTIAKEAQARLNLANTASQAVEIFPSAASSAAELILF
jgi:hypothetical protein